MMALLRRATACGSSRSTGPTIVPTAAVTCAASSFSRATPLDATFRGLTRSASASIVRASSSRVRSISRSSDSGSRALSAMDVSYRLRTVYLIRVFQDPTPYVAPGTVSAADPMYGGCTNTGRIFL